MALLVGMWFLALWPVVFVLYLVGVDPETGKPMPRTFAPRRAARLAWQQAWAGYF